MPMVAAEAICAISFRIVQKGTQSAFFSKCAIMNKSNGLMIAFEREFEIFGAVKLEAEPLFFLLTAIFENTGFWTSVQYI